MITRGYYIGEIVDELSSIAAQVKMRNRIGLTDLTVYAENFFRDVLNILLGAQLTNLNQDRSNEPGLDLGDDVFKLGVQVTSTATSDKVNSTLGKITGEQAGRFDKFIVLVVGSKQGSYSLDGALAPKYKFTEKEIWDLDKLARLAINLGIEDLRRLHKLVRSEVARLKIELEVPDDQGKYPTSAYDQWEEAAKAKVSDGAAFLKFLKDEYDYELRETESARVAVALKDLASRLGNLPRITREFLVTLIERREAGKSRRFGDKWMHLIYPKIQRQYRGVDLDGELEILKHARFVDVEGYDQHEYGSPEVGVCITHESDDLALEFVKYVNKRGLTLRKVLGEVDLSAF